MSILSSFLHFFLLFVLSCAHECIHHKSDVIRRLTSEVAHQPSVVHYASLPKGNAHSINASQSTVARIRMGLSTANIVDNRMYCEKEGDIRTTFTNGPTNCTKDDVLTEQKRKILTEKLLPQAFAMLNEILAVNPVQGNLVVGGNCRQYGILVPPTDSTEGVPGVDHLVYILAGPVRSSTKAEAWAAHCAVDAVGRPIASVININPSTIAWDQNNTSNNWPLMNIVLHEIFHGLGFDPNVWQNSKVTRCIQSVERRRGSVVHVIRGPQTSRIAQQYFGCSHMSGPELEEIGPYGQMGAHWKSRFHHDDLMSPYVNSFMYLSPLTLALMQDLGFYTVNWMKARIPNWMRNIGCDAIYSKCNGGTSTGEGKYFCFKEDRHGCTPDRLSVGRCDIVRWTGPLKEPFTYFTDPAVGGRLESMNYCPIYAGFRGMHCTRDTSMQVEGFDTVKDFGFTYGKNSRCYETFKNVVKLGGSKPKSQITARCFDTFCEYKNGKMRMAFRIGTNNQWISCPHQNFVVDMRPFGFSGGVYCPDPWDVCTLDLRPQPGVDERLPQLPIIPYTPNPTQLIPTDSCAPAPQIPFIESEKRVLKSTHTRTLSSLFLVLFVVIFIV